MTEAERAALEAWLYAQAAATAVEIGAANRLSGGAIQQNWGLDLKISGGEFAGAQRWVLRTDAPSSVSVSRSRAEEFALLRAAHAAGVTVPEPLFLCTERAVLGRPFFIMRRVDGIAAGFRVVKRDDLAGGREQLAATLGRELARIHAIRPPQPDLGFLPPPGPESPAERLIATFRRQLYQGRLPRPALEWGLRWMQRNAPPSREIVLCHNDFRTGNYMVTEAGITGVLDWEFAGWGDPLEDVGWLCARCWRFGNRSQEVGGISPRAPFYAAYEAESGRRIEPDLVAYWEVAAAMRWALVAIEQAERHISRAECNLELALTGHIVPELELDVLAMTGAEHGG